MNYIINNALGCKLYQENDDKNFSMNALSYVKKLCLIHLFTYEGYIKACQKSLNFKYKIPLYINECIQLIPIKSVRLYNNIWINAANIKSYKEDAKGVVVTFYDQSTVLLTISKKTLKAQIKRLNEIREVKLKHFHW